MTPKRESDNRSTERNPTNKPQSTSQPSGGGPPEPGDEKEQPAPAPLEPNATPIGESRDNLRGRQEWFRRRSGGS